MNSYLDQLRQQLVNRSMHLAVLFHTLYESMAPCGKSHIGQLLKVLNQDQPSPNLDLLLNRLLRSDQSIDLLGDSRRARESKPFPNPVFTYKIPMRYLPH